MEKLHRDLLRSNYRVLAQEISTAIDDVCGYLYEKDILSEPMKQDILANNTPFNQAYQLLDIVPKRGPRAFEVLYEACKEEQLFKACDELMPHNAPHEPPEEEEEFELESDSADPTNEEGEDPWTKSSYMTSLRDYELSYRTVVDRSLYEKHIGDESFYQMTNEVRGQLFFLQDTEGCMLSWDRKILDCLCRKMNFQGIKRKPIRQQEDLKLLQLEFNTSCDCLMLFVDCGQRGFFNEKGEHGLKLLKETLKNNESLANKPKLVFHMTSTSKKSDEAEEKGKEIDVKNGETGKEEKEDEQNGLTAVPDQNKENPQWSGGGELIPNIKHKSSVPPQDNPEDKSLDSPDGPIPKDSDIIIIKVTDYGCEIVEVWDEITKEKLEITRFLHLIVDAFLNNAYRSPFFDLLADANDRAKRGGGSDVATCKVTGRKKLYFFPGCQKD